MNKDLVERLRSDKRVSQFNSAGILESYEAMPSAIEIEAADMIERLRAEIEQLRAASQWRKIDDSTPRQTPLLVWHPGFGMGGWNAMAWDADGWRETASDGRRLKDGYEPSHWQPLPSPPTQDGGE